MAGNKTQKTLSSEEIARGWLAPIDTTSDRDKRREKIKKEKERTFSKMPYKEGESIPPEGGVAREWTGPRPWKKVKGKGDHSTAKPL